VKIHNEDKLGLSALNRRLKSSLEIVSGMHTDDFQWVIGNNFSHFLYYDPLGRHETDQLDCGLQPIP